jgi:hypothetical protein
MLAYASSWASVSSRKLLIRFGSFWCQYWHNVRAVARTIRQRDRCFFCLRRTYFSCAKDVFWSYVLEFSTIDVTICRLSETVCLSRSKSAWFNCWLALESTRELLSRGLGRFTPCCSTATTAAAADCGSTSSPSSPVSPSSSSFIGAVGLLLAVVVVSSRSGMSFSDRPSGTNPFLVCSTTRPYCSPTKARVEQELLVFFLAVFGRPVVDAAASGVVVAASDEDEPEDVAFRKSVFFSSANFKMIQSPSLTTLDRS